MSNEFKIRIVQRWVPQYRVSLFDGLGKKYGDRLSIWASKEDMGVSCPLIIASSDYSHAVVRLGGLQWQRGLTTKGLRRGDVLVVGGDIHNVSSLFMSFVARIKGVGVVWWGHHKTANSKMRNVRIRLCLAKLLSDVYLCYTKTGIVFLEESGFKRDCVFATGNTIDQLPIKEAIEKYGPEALKAFRLKHGLVGKHLILTCGAVHKKMRLHQLIRAMASGCLANEEVVLAVIGDGPELGTCKQLAGEIGVNGRIIWVGATSDQMILAPWFLSANVFVYPGAIGLSIMHAFSYGVPVVTHGNVSNQMPEFEVMENGKTGFVFEEDNIEDLARTVQRMIQDSASSLTMGKYAQHKVFAAYSMDNMISNFAEAIEAAHKITLMK